MVQDGFEEGSRPRQTLVTPFIVLVVVSMPIGATAPLGFTLEPETLNSYPVRYW